MWLVTFLIIFQFNLSNAFPTSPSTDANISVNSSVPEVKSLENVVEKSRRNLISTNVDPSVDTNNDGVLDVDEVRYAAFVHHGLSSSVVSDMFKQVDTDHNGVLDNREFDSIRKLVLERAENAALRYLQTVDVDHDGFLSLQEAQIYLLREYGIGNRDVTRLWKLVTPNSDDKLNATMFSRLRRRVRGMTIRLARQHIKNGDLNGDGHISVDEAKAIAFEQEGIGAGDVASMVESVDENMDGELNAPEFADFERIIRAKALENSKRAIKVVDSDNSGTLTLDEATRVAFEHYGFDEMTLTPFFGQADENEDEQLDPVEFAGFRSVIRSRSVKDATEKLKNIDIDKDGLISSEEAILITQKEDDMEPSETLTLFAIADQNKSGKLDKVELADFIRLVRLSSIKFATDHFKEFDLDGNDVVTFDEIALLIEQKYGIPKNLIKTFFDKIDVDKSQDLIPAEIVDFRHLIRNHVSQQRKEKPITVAPPPPPPVTPSTPAWIEETLSPLFTSTLLSEIRSKKLPKTMEITDEIGNDVIAQDIAEPKNNFGNLLKEKTNLTLTTMEVIEIPKNITTLLPNFHSMTTTFPPSTTKNPPKPSPPNFKLPPQFHRKNETNSNQKLLSNQSDFEESKIEEMIRENKKEIPANSPSNIEINKNEEGSYEEIIEYVDE